MAWKDSQAKQGVQVLQVKPELLSENKQTIKEKIINNANGIDPPDGEKTSGCAGYYTDAPVARRSTSAAEAAEASQHGKGVRYEQ